MINCYIYFNADRGAFSFDTISNKDYENSVNPPEILMDEATAIEVCNVLNNGTVVGVFPDVQKYIPDLISNNYIM